MGSLAVARPGRFGRKLAGASHATISAGAFGARFAEVRIDPELSASATLRSRALSLRRALAIARRRQYHQGSGHDPKGSQRFGISAASARS